MDFPFWTQEMISQSPSRSVYVNKSWSFPGNWELADPRLEDFFLIFGAETISLFSWIPFGWLGWCVFRDITKGYWAVVSEWCCVASKIVSVKVSRNFLGWRKFREFPIVEGMFHRSIAVPDMTFVYPTSMCFSDDLGSQPHWSAFAIGLI